MHFIGIGNLCMNGKAESFIKDWHSVIANKNKRIAYAFENRLFVRESKREGKREQIERIK